MVSWDRSVIHTTQHLIDLGNVTKFQYEIILVAPADRRNQRTAFTKLSAIGLDLLACSLHNQVD